MKLPDKLTKKLDQNQLCFLKTFFKNCPDDFADNLILKTYHSNQRLITTDDSCAHVYILLKGRLQAIEERATDTDYCFTMLTAFEIIGDFELFSQTPTRLITLSTIAPSLCLVIPANAYLKWIRSDSNALFIRIQMLVNQLCQQTQSERQTFFQNNEERFLHFLFNECLTQSAETYIIRQTRQDIATRIGCSFRTVNRLAAQLQDDGHISLVHGKIHISPEQFMWLKERILAMKKY